MSRTLAIASREWCSFFQLPIGWVVLALYLALCGGVFGLFVLAPGQPATMRPLFALSTWLMLFVAPAISMRLFAEEYRSRSIDGLVSAPVTDWQIVIGKYLGGVGFLLAMIAPTIVFVFVLEAVSNPDYGPILLGYLGMAMVGSLYLALGALASSLTSNQTVAFLGALFTLLMLKIATVEGAEKLDGPLAVISRGLSVDFHLESFAKGVLDTGDLAFFLAGCVWFVTLTAISLESRRWR
jgi:ABC-2 type transport system permease protein